MYRSLTTMGAVTLVVRWCLMLLVGVGFQAHSQAISPPSEVDSSYNFYYEQPCCNGPTIKSKYHVRHRRGFSAATNKNDSTRAVQKEKGHSGGQGGKVKKEETYNKRKRRALRTLKSGNLL
ncbi:unnamed protein product [Plutella xylostella]|uniref:(diamondback moth) hypothetical protein n=1 Tax=Plutella xylostella TaxID=51655 RepID=A0A8S4DF95_PLUXY|nr:unnamed protein product [Plutella xylostella]